MRDPRNAAPLPSQPAANGPARKAVVCGIAVTLLWGALVLAGLGSLFLGRHRHYPAGSAVSSVQDRPGEPGLLPRPDPFSTRLVVTITPLHDGGQR